VRVQPDVVVELRADETVLEGLYRHGYAYRTGCRRGGCGVCKVDLVSGTVRYTRVISQAVLTDEERASGTCLTCRAVPLDDVTIALREEELSRNPLLAFLCGASPSTRPPSQRATGRPTPSIPELPRGDEQR
jgi:ferredoxin